MTRTRCPFTCDGIGKCMAGKNKVFFPSYKTLFSNKNVCERYICIQNNMKKFHIEYVKGPFTYLV